MNNIVMTQKGCDGTRLIPLRQVSLKPNHNNKMRKDNNDESLTMDDKST